MPVTITKTGSRYRVSTPGGTKSKATTKKKSEAQKRIIEAADRRKGR